MMKGQSVPVRERMPANSRKRQIVETVLELVAQHGPDAVSAQLVADAVGISQPAVFRHFATKEAIWTAVIDLLRDRLAQVWAEARGDQEDSRPLWVLKRMFLGHIELITRYPGFAKIVMSDHIRHQYPSLHENFKALHQEYDRLVTTLLQEAAQQGELSSDVDLSAAAALYFCSIQGLAFQFAIAGYRQSRIWETAVRVFDLYLRALGAETSGSGRRRRNIDRENRGKP